MKTFRSIVIVLFVVFALTFEACRTVPLTGRKQFTAIPAGQMLSMSYAQYDAFLQENPPVSTSPEANTVKDVGRNIQSAVEQYFAEKDISDQLKDFEWDFNLVNDDAVNAWCMPGGKVVIYSGILPVAQDANGLAVVMGHEISHALARHGNERMSQVLLAQVGGIALDVALSNKPQQTRAMWNQVYGIGAQVGVLLPYSRKHESEADELGLVFMAMAGYDPTEAVGFWQRMDKASSGAQPPQFLSTHPSHEKRISDIQAHLPEALKYFKPGGIQPKKSGTIQKTSGTKKVRIKSVGN